MNNDKFNQFDKIAREIFECRECSFWKPNADIVFRPDPPLYNKDNSGKIIVVGLNGKWSEKYCSFVRQHTRDDYETYKQAWLNPDRANTDNTGIRYAGGIVKTAYWLGLITEDITNKIRIKDYVTNNVIQGNLSFCPSNTSEGKGTRRANEWGECPHDIIRCNLNEERSNCLEKGFLCRMITILNPELVIFFTSKANDLLSKIFDVDINYLITPDNWEPDFVAYNRGKTQVMTSVMPYLIRDRKVKILVRPHTSMPMTVVARSCMEQKIKKAKKWFDKTMA